MQTDLTTCFFRRLFRIGSTGSIRVTRSCGVVGVLGSLGVGSVEGLEVEEEVGKAGVVLPLSPQPEMKALPKIRLVAIAEYAKTRAFLFMIISSQAGITGTFSVAISLFFGNQFTKNIQKKQKRNVSSNK